MDIREKIIKLREEKGWSQYRLYKEANIGQSTLSQIESGARYPNVATLQKIASALGVSMSEFDLQEQNKKEAAKALPQLLEKMKHMELSDKHKEAYRIFLSMSEEEKGLTVDEAISLLKKYNSLSPEGKQAVGSIINLLAQK
ncbi:MAG: helix-turn-helix transcriptional regulator [Anaeromusa sp.]|uniref:helix-turn-helix domain-containing protein n=1 Tax=Anaeromusa sp. TaxID=1872520 RepID=UPI002B202FB0|nr:helix-turn-helix transcriptional regulator [Anaeromusa sp.]MEA4835325.1 helix-turn-helix transcriptional regulator [Anaeromusa sp.]